MKKFTLFLFATLFSALSFAALNPYAYGLSSMLDGTTLKVNYSLNAPATAVSVVIMDGETEVKTIACDGKTAKGSHTVEISTLDLPTGKSLTWKVEVRGAAVTSVAIHDVKYNAYHPSGIDIDNNPESPNFGRILCTEAMHAVKGKTRTDGKTGTNVKNYLGTTLGAGIYEFDPAFTFVKGYTGGKTFVTTSNHFAPRRIRISKDGRIFATAQDNSGEYLWELNPNDLDSWTSVFQGTKSDFTLKDGSGNFIAGTNSGFDVRGTGENLQLLMLSADKPGAQVAAFKLHEYNLGNATSWSTVPTREFSNCKRHEYMITNQSQVQYDNEGGYWITYWVNTTEFGGIAHFTKEGVEDFKKDKINMRNAGFRFNHDFTKVIIATNDVTGASKTYKQATVYTVSKDANGAPVLTKETTIDMTTVGNNLNDFAWDYADNIYVVGNSSEYVAVYPYTHAADKVVSTPCASKYAFEVEEIVANVYTLTTNVVGEGTIEGNAGSYVEGTTATLTATPAEHYDFLNWTYGSETSTDNPLSLVVNSDITVTANFAPVQYTLIAPTNDEDKGTVTGAGTYNYGTEVTLTANPAAGYKLLYWSDRSTENPRTITMNKDEAISAYFVKEYDEEPTFTITKVWENTNVPASTSNGYQAVGWDGKIYMQDAGHSKIITFSDEADTGTEYATSGAGQQIAIDEAGNLIVFNATFYSATPNAILIYQKGSTTGKVVNFTLSNPARCDFFSASGNIFSAEGGYVYFYCNGKQVINRLKITNGAATAADVMTDIVGGSIYETTMNQNHVMVDIFGNLVTHARANALNTINVYTNEVTVFTDLLSGIKKTTLGGCSFELGGKELWAYNVGTTNFNSEWNIYNITDTKFLSNEALYINNKTLIGSAANWLNVQVVNENTAYIYQFCPKVGAAVWKVSRDIKYNVSVTADNGTVAGAGKYKEGTTATLTATPNARYDFVNWTKGGVEVSTDATYSFEVTEDVELVANFSKKPDIAYELNGGQWNKYGWTSKKDMYNAFVTEWKAYSGSTQYFCSYETQLGIGNSNQGLPTAILSAQPILEFMAQDKWAWLGQFLDALATAQGKATMPTANGIQMRWGLGNFFGEDNNGSTTWQGAVDCSAGQANPEAFQPTWGHVLSNPTQPTTTIELGSPYREGYEFGGWYAESDFSGVPVTAVDENTTGTFYAKWTELVYTRNVKNGEYGTICLPYASSNYTGAEFYEISYMELEADGVTPRGVWLDQVADDATLEAGKPYIFKGTSTLLTVYYEGDEVLNPIEGMAGLIGTFTKIEDLNSTDPSNTLEGNYMIAQNQIWLCGTGCWLNANRAYIDHDIIHANTTPKSKLPGRRRVCMGSAGESTATGTEGAVTPNVEVIKRIENGRVIIIRDGVKYNLQGMRLQ